MPCIILRSAKDTDSDKTLGLGLGADDYITKPFSVTEVLARIKANIRRKQRLHLKISSRPYRSSFYFARLSRIICGEVFYSRLHPLVPC